MLILAQTILESSKNGAPVHLPVPLSRVFQQLLERLLLGLRLVQLIHTPLKVCTGSSGRAVSAAVPGRLTGHQREQGYKIGNKVLGIFGHTFESGSDIEVAIAENLVVITCSIVAKLSQVIMPIQCHILTPLAHQSQLEPKHVVEQRSL